MFFCTFLALLRVPSPCSVLNHRPLTVLFTEAWPKLHTWLTHVTSVISCRLRVLSTIICRWHPNLCPEFLPSSSKSQRSMPCCTSSPEFHNTSTPPWIQKLNSSLHLSPVILCICPKQTLQVLLNPPLSVLPICSQLPSPVTFTIYRFLQSIHISSSPLSPLPQFRSSVLDLSSVRCRGNAQVEMSMRQLDIEIWSLKKRDTEVWGTSVKGEALGDMSIIGAKREGDPASEGPKCVRVMLSWEERKGGFQEGGSG